MNLKNILSTKTKLILFVVNLFLFSSCSKNKEESKEEQIQLSPTEQFTESAGDSVNSIQKNDSFFKIPTQPNSVILTGLSNQRLISIYKTKLKKESDDRNVSSYFYSEQEEENGSIQHFMPGLDILYGYNLLNMAHFNLKTEKLSLLFNEAILIKTVYYPSYTQDSILNQPINRNFYLVSVYDQDTNGDSLINKHDLRRIYHFDENNTKKSRLIPAHYSVLKSQYDTQNDLMYVYATEDENKNGKIEKTERTHIFYVNLKNPLETKKMY